MLGPVHPKMCEPKYNPSLKRTWCSSLAWHFEHPYLQRSSTKSPSRTSSISILYHSLSMISLMRSTSFSFPHQILKPCLPLNLKTWLQTWNPIVSSCSSPTRVHSLKHINAYNFLGFPCDEKWGFRLCAENEKKKSESKKSEFDMNEAEKLARDEIKCVEGSGI